MTRYFILLLLLAGCAPNEKKEQGLSSPKDSVPATSVAKNGTAAPQVNDSLNAVAQLIAGTYAGTLFPSVTKSSAYKDFSGSFSRRWQEFDSSRISRLKIFRSKELAGDIKKEPLLFYPFSGPDILYANLFFPSAEKFVLIGLEPVGTLPEFHKLEKDSLKRYYQNINASLNAILKFSFFRTESMSKDLKNTEVDGTLHLLLLFLSRTGNALVSAKPVTIDSLGNTVYLDSFQKLKASKFKTKGVEIFFKTPGDSLKEVTYYSMNAADQSLKTNRGFQTYLGSLKNFNTYLKGASYLLHKPYFSIVRSTILNGSSTIVQDDSGIAFRYFLKNGTAWNYKLFGEYTKPISLFSNAYQKDLDSLYRLKGATPLGFGIGYNFKDKNSNLMVAKRS